MSVRERLDGISEKIHEANELEHGVSGESYVVFEKGDILWLIRQAERVQVLERRFNIERGSHLMAEDKLCDSKAENARLREALEYYADERNYVIWNSMAISRTGIEMDKGQLARRALKGESE